MDKVILHKWLKAGVIENGLKYPTTNGVPQGGPVSPVIANLALDGLEPLLKQRFAPANHRAERPKVNLCRFADDFVITGASKEVLEKVKPLVADFLAERGLSLSPEKTVISHIDEGFDFLGMNCRKYRGKLLIKPSRKAVKRFKQTFSEKLAKLKTAPQEAVIAGLAPLILGWARYYRHVVSSVIFKGLDRWIFFKLWQWAKRRHPGKPRRWIARRYFHTVKGDHWVFQVSIAERLSRLPKMAWLPIRRFKPVKGTANPYDPNSELYFERRSKAKLLGQSGARFQSLFKQQNGLCPVCEEGIDDGRAWDFHHIIEKCRGGGDTLDNLLLLHANCHQQVHAAHLDVGCPVRNKIVLCGLSRLRGNAPERFLGEGVAAMSLPYPTL